jgi:hypothetical protein
MRKFLSAILLFAAAASQEASACSFVQGATADAKVFHNGALIYQNRVVGCYNQQTGGNASCTTVLQHVQESAATQAIINTLKSRGGCGNVGVQVAARLGTRDRVDCGSRTYNTGGTWIAAVPASCPSGFSLINNACIKKSPVTWMCPRGWELNPSENRCKKLVAGCNLPSAPANGTAIGTYGFVWNGGIYVWGNAQNGGAATPACISGFTFQNGECIQTAPVIPAVAAYCKR